MMYHLGQQVDDFRLSRYLGRGPLTEVYLAEHIRINSLRIAIKVTLEQSFAINAVLNNRYRALDNLKNSHIVGSRGYAFINNSVPILKVDYASEGSLRDKFAAGSFFDFPFIIACVLQIAAALDYAHGKGIVHGNLKPENILFDAQSNILLSDFDVQVYPFQQSPLVLNALRYVAPEQREGKTLPASDQYQLACFVHEWLSNQGPFTERDIFQAHLSIPGMVSSGEIERVTRKAMAHDYTRRYGTMQEFAEDLRVACRVNSVETPVNSLSSIPLKQSSVKQLSLTIRVISVILLILLIGSGFLAGALIKSHTSANVTPVVQNTISPQALFASVMKSRSTFDDSLNGHDSSHWLLQRDRSGDGCVFMGGALHLVSTKADVINCLLQGLTVSDFAFQTTMTILQPGDVEAGLLLRANQRTLATYLFFLDTLFYNSNFNVQGPDGTHVSQSSWYSAAFQTALRKPNVLTVIARKNMFYLYINDVFVNTITDDRYQSGSLGVYTSVGSNTNMDVAFNNAKVWT